jgi:hypothetical protein
MITYKERISVEVSNEKYNKYKKWLSFIIIWSDLSSDKYKYITIINKDTGENTDYEIIEIEEVCNWLVIWFKNNYLSWDITMSWDITTPLNNHKLWSWVVYC